MLLLLFFKCPVNHVDFTKVKQYGSSSDSHMGQQRNLILQSTLNVESDSSVHTQHWIHYISQSLIVTQLFLFITKQQKLTSEVKLSAIQNADKN